jgi:hypothetical protein
MKHQVDEYAENYELLKSEVVQNLVFEAIRTASPKVAHQVFSDNNTTITPREFVVLIGDDPKEAIEKINRIMKTVTPIK